MDKKIKTDPGRPRITMFLSLDQRNIIAFANLAKMRKKSLDHFLDEAIADKLEQLLSPSVRSSD